MEVCITDGIGDELFIHHYCGYDTLKKYVDLKKSKGFRKIKMNLLDFQDDEYWEAMKNDIIKVGVYSNVGIEKLEWSHLQ